VREKAVGIPCRAEKRRRKKNAALEHIKGRHIDYITQTQQRRKKKELLGEKMLYNSWRGAYEQ
jgi:hypothetical protein